MPSKAIFLDRDDTLIEDPGYLSDPDQVRLLDGVPKALIDLRAMGYKLVVVTNQSAVARGIITEQKLAEIHQRLEQLLAASGARLDRIYYCPYHPDGSIPKYRRESDQRKPNPGMLLRAADEMDIDLQQSWMIGNSPRDIEAGLRAGCMTILLDPPSHQAQPNPGDPRPHYRAVNIKEAVNIIKKHHRSQSANHLPSPAAPSAATTTASATHQPPSPPEPDQHKPAQPPAPAATESAVSSPPPSTGPSDDQTEIASTDRPAANPSQDTPATADQTVSQLLAAILDQLKRMHRTEMFGEFSVMRLLAGLVQMLALFCLVVTVWLLISPNRSNGSVFIALGFAAVFQMMALTFYLMHERR